MTWKAVADNGVGLRQSEVHELPQGCRRRPVLVALLFATALATRDSGSVASGEEPPEQLNAAVEASSALHLGWATFESIAGATAPFVLASVVTGPDMHQVSVVCAAPEEGQNAGDLKAAAVELVQRVPACATLCLSTSKWVTEADTPSPAVRVKVSMPVLRDRRRRVVRGTLDVTPGKVSLEAERLRKRVLYALDAEGHYIEGVDLRDPFVVGPRTCEIRRLVDLSGAVESIQTQQCVGLRVASLKHSEVTRALYNVSQSRDWMVMQVEIRAQPPSSSKAAATGWRRYMLSIDAVYLPSAGE